MLEREEWKRKGVRDVLGKEEGVCGCSCRSLRPAGGRGSFSKGFGMLVRPASKAFLFAWPGNDGIRHSRRRLGGDRHFGHFGFSPQVAGALGCDSERNQRFVADDSGQATVEYVVVLAGVLCVVAGLGALGNAFESGLVMEHVLAAASHHVQGSAGGLLDVFAY